MTLIQNLDVTVLVAIIIAFGTIITAIGVWLVPPLTEYLRRRREIKERVRRWVLELGYYSEKGREIERDLICIGKDVVGPLKTELKSTENELVRSIIEKVLYGLGDKRARETLLARFEGIIRSSKDYEEIRDALEDIEELKIVELAPLLLKRLQEKDDITAYNIIKTLGTLGYKPALPYILQLADECLGASEEHISRACIMAIDDIISKNLNVVTAEELSRAASVYTAALRGKDMWSIDAVVRCKLPVLLKRKDELRDPLKKELVEVFVKLLNNGRFEIEENAVKRLAQLEDKRAVPYLRRKLQEEGAASSIRPLLERALQVLEG